MLFAMSLQKISLYTVRSKLQNWYRSHFAWYSKCCHCKARKKVPCKDVFAIPCNEIIDIPLSLPARNAIAYVAGYLLWKYPMTDCQQCQNKCKLVKMPENNALYEFLKEKAYTEVSGLTYPTVCMIMFVGETGVIVFIYFWSNCSYVLSHLLSLQQCTEYFQGSELW